MLILLHELCIQRFNLYIADAASRCQKLPEQFQRGQMPFIGIGSHRLSNQFFHPGIVLLIKFAQHLTLRLFNTSVLPHYLLNAYLLTLGQQPFFNVVNTKLLLVEILVQLFVYEGIVPYPAFGRNPLGRHSAPPKRALNILLMGGDTHKDRHRAIFKRFPPLNKK